MFNFMQKIDTCQRIYLCYNATMEIANNVQESQKKIASGFCALRDKAGHWICQTVSLNQDNQLSVAQNLQFQPCEKIQHELTNNQIDVLVPSFENGRAGLTLDADKVQIDSAEQNVQQTVAATPKMVAENRQEYHR